MPPPLAHSAAASSTPLLQVDHLSVRFDGIVALDDVSITVSRGAVVGLIGPNGAGKTTLFNIISRLVRCDSGWIGFDGVPLLDRPAHSVAGLGIARTFQNLALFASLDVLANVRAGGLARGGGSWLDHALRRASARADDEAMNARALELVQLLGLEAMRDAPVGSLPFASRKRVELARALAGVPRLLLLDEPAGGLHHGEVEDLGRLILQLRDRFELTVLLVEHHMGLVRQVSDRVVVLDFGRKIAEGSPDEIGRDSDVRRAYLGAVA